MRHLIILFVMPGFFACNRQHNNSQLLESRLDSLQKMIPNTYKPGFGEFMSSIQTHHAKLWFAGQNKNWKLAEFEIHEIIETIENIQKYQAERKESRLIREINPAMDSMNRAIKQKDPALFKSSYTLLTKTCNDCHRKVGFEFNVVKIPDYQTFSNQNFEADESK